MFEPGFAFIFLIQRNKQSLKKQIGDIKIFNTTNRPEVPQTYKPSKQIRLQQLDYEPRCRELQSIAIRK